MTANPFLESGMDFSPLAGRDCWHVERSDVYGRVQDGVKIAEFVALRGGNRVFVIEAKSSSPRPGNRENLSGYLLDIHEKMINAMSLFLACRLDRHQAVEDMPGALRSVALDTLDFCFCLVIRGHKKEWLVPLQDALRPLFLAAIRTWGFHPQAVIVINDEIAARRGWLAR